MQYMLKRDENLFIDLYYSAKYYGAYFFYCVILELGILALQGCKFIFFTLLVKISRNFLCSK